MAEENTNQQNPTLEPGQALIQWEFPEYVQHSRPTWWYVIAGLGGRGIIIWALMDGNFLFALIILLFAFILFTDRKGEPITVQFGIYERGVQIGRNFYLFRELNSFAVVYEPPHVERLYLMPKTSVLRNEFSVPLEGKDPLHIRSLLLDYLIEDLERETESNSDAVSRFFKIQ